MKRVTFSDKVLIREVSKQEERRGFWEVDAMRFRERIRKFEIIFKPIILKKKVI